MGLCLPAYLACQILKALFYVIMHTYHTIPYGIMLTSPGESAATRDPTVLRTRLAHFGTRLAHYDSPDGSERGWHIMIPLMVRNAVGTL